MKRKERRGRGDRFPKEERAMGYFLEKKVIQNLIQ